MSRLPGSSRAVLLRVEPSYHLPMSPSLRSTVAGRKSLKAEGDTPDRVPLLIASDEPPSAARHQPQEALRVHIS